MIFERRLQMRGISLDLPADEVPADQWSFGKNVFFRDLATQRIPGYESYHRVVGDVPVFAYPVQRKSGSLWIIIVQRGANTLLRTWDGTTIQGIRNYGALDALSLDWNATDHNGTIVINNGVEAPRYWNEAGGTMDLLPGWPANVTCKTIRSFKYHLIAMGLTDTSVDSDYEYMWSDQSAPGPGNIPQSWTAGASTDAGNNQIASPQGFIVDGIGLRDSFLIFKDFSCHLLQYIGGTFIFSQRDLYISAGMINTRCAVTIDSNAIVATQDDIIFTDGNTMQSICTYDVRRHIFDKINPEAIRYCQMVKRHLYDEVWFCYPTESSEYCNEAAIYNTKTDKWGIRPLPDVSCLSYGLANYPGAEVSWDSRTTLWNDDPHIWDDTFYSNTNDEIVMCQPYAPGALDGYVYINDRGDSANGQPIEAEVKREGIVLDDDPQTIKTINQIWLHVDGRDGDIIQVQAGGAMSERDPVKWSPAVPFVIGSPAGKVDLHSVGRLSAFRFYTLGGAPWRIYDFRVRYHVQGRY